MLNNKDDELTMLMPIAELAKYMQTEAEELEGDNSAIYLLEIPAKRLQLSAISLQANLQQAHERFEHDAEALYVVFNEELGDKNSRIYGVITEDMVEGAYKKSSQ
jgi:hypothetical protein